MVQIPFDSGANYYEIYIKPNIEINEDNEKTIIDNNLTVKQFLELLGCMKKSDANSFKYFQKEYKEYLYTDIILQNYKNTELRVFRQNFVNINSDKHYTMIGFNRSKLTFLSVPSTTNIHDMIYVKRLIFRVNNRIFVNFQISLHKDGKKTYQVFINYNHETNIDPEGVTKTLDDVMKILTT